MLCCDVMFDVCVIFVICYLLYSLVAVVSRSQVWCVALTLCRITWHMLLAFYTPTLYRPCHPITQAEPSLAHLVVASQSHANTLIWQNTWLWYCDNQTCQAWRQSLSVHWHALYPNLLCCTGRERMGIGEIQGEHQLSQFGLRDTILCYDFKGFPRNMDKLA